MFLPFCKVSIILLFVFNESQASRILALAPIGTKSHTSGFEPLYHALASLGHHVTIITNHVPSKPVRNVRYIKNFDSAEVMGNFSSNPFEMRLQGKALNCFGIPEIYQTFCRRTYEVPEIMNLMQEDFDLIIVNSFLNECIYGLASQYKNAKVMFFSTLPLLSWVSSIFGNPVSPSHVPIFVRGYSDAMTFSQRVINFITTVEYYFLRNYVHIPQMEKIYKEFIPSAPSVHEFERRMDLILINSHPLINYPRALLPNMIETSGLQCKEGKALPKDLQDFIEGAGDHGVIYFSLGSFLQGSQLPEAYRISFVRAFTKLKQRVIWKFETEGMDDLPPNVKLGKWFPQQDILAHPSIRLFITHGGLLSIQEAVFHGVPLLGIPLFGDQDGNLEQAFHKGFSLTLDFEAITEPLVSQKLEEVLGNPLFQQKAKEMSAIYRDRPQPPLDTAIFWTEYLLKSKNSSHLHSAGRNLTTMEYHSIDVISLLIIILITATYIVFKIIKCTILFVYSYLRRRFSKQQKVKRR